MSLFDKACLGLLLALTWAHATKATTQTVSLSGDCLKRSSQLFCSTFYSSYLSSCLRTVNGQSFVLKYNAYCYIPSRDTECISAEICADPMAPKPTVSVESFCVI